MCPYIQSQLTFLQHEGLRKSISSIGDNLVIALFPSNFLISLSVLSLKNLTQKKIQGKFYFRFESDHNALIRELAIFSIIFFCAQKLRTIVLALPFDAKTPSHMKWLPILSTVSHINYENHFVHSLHNP